jgi:hypothetical protein
MAAGGGGPTRTLIRHFFHGLFDLGFLSETGVASFTRTIIGVCTAFISLGLLLLRIFSYKYADFWSDTSPLAYREAIVTDHAFLMGLPMWVVAVVTVLIGHALFPDHTDFRVLTPLPLTRRVIFQSKLTALALFNGLFVVSTHVALAPVFLLTSINQWAEGTFVARAAAFEVANLLAALFGALAVTAVLGLLFLAPRRGFTRASTALKSALILALVLALPLLLRLPGQERAFGREATWLLATPPAWFVGIERWLLGHDDPFTLSLARLAGAAFLIVGGIAVGSYAVLYARFERVIRPADDRSRARTHWHVPIVGFGRPIFNAVRLFTLLTLQRSALHQGVLVALAALGAGLVANSFIAAGLLPWLPVRDRPSSALVNTAVWAPFPLVLFATAAVRAALVVPIELRANWVFRMTEDPDRRANQLSASVHVVRHLGVTVPVLLVAPLQIAVLGWQTLPVDVVACLCGWLFAEILLHDWARVPFTCSYVPGKGFVPQMILKGLLTFVLFTSFGSALAHLTRLGITAAYVLVAIVALAIVVMWRRRLGRWRRVPIEFEDTLPSDLNGLRLFD